jgi:acyl-CoA thioesterase I
MSLKKWPRIVCLGDSVTAGEHVPTSERWTTRLAEDHPEVNVLTRGVCGDTTRLGLERWLGDVEVASPNIVVVQFGHNDCNRWGVSPRVSERAYAANLAEMIERAQAIGARPVICTPHRTSYDDEYEAMLARYAEAARQVCREKFTSLVDVRARDDLFPHPGVLADGLHPSPWGHTKLAELIEEVLF